MPISFSFFVIVCLNEHRKLNEVQLFRIFFSASQIYFLFVIVIGVRAGGARGAAAPPNFGQLEKIWAKPVFMDVSMFFISLKRQIFSTLIWKNPEVSVIIQLLSLETLTVVSNTWWISGYRDGYHLLIYIFIVFYCWALYCTALTGMGSFQSWID